MSFRFTRVFTEIYKDELREKLVSDLHDSFIEEIMLLVDQSELTMITGILARYCPFDDVGGMITFRCVDWSISMSTDDFTAFCYYYRDGKSKVINRKFLAMSKNLWRDYHYKKSIDAPQKEDGQAKIGMSTMLTIIEAPQHVNILVLGSSSEGDAKYVSGRSYQVLIDMMPKMGYTGSITLYDPYETAREYDIRGFHVKHVAGKYDYKTKLYGHDGGEITHIMDDVWCPMITSDPKKIPSYDRVRYDLRDGYSKFAYGIINDGDARVMYIANGYKKHKEFPGDPLGGGWIRKYQNNVIISGSSTRFGPFDSDFIKRVFSQFNLTVHNDLKFGRYNIDPDMNLFKMYPKAVISCKYFGEKDFPEGRIESQLFYNGLEKRIYINSPNVDYDEYGCGCEKCVVYNRIIYGFKCYNTRYSHEHIRNMLFSLVGDSHVKNSQGIYSLILSYLRQGKHVRGPLNVMVDKIKKRYHCKEQIIYRCYAYLCRSGELKSNDDAFKDFNCYVFDRKTREHRFYKDPNSYVVMYSGKKFLPGDYRILLSNTDDIGDIIIVARKIFEKYKDMISIACIGDDYYYGTGTLTFGDNMNYDLFYSTFEQDMVVDLIDYLYLCKSPLQSISK